MLKELAQATAAQAWVIAAMLFFVSVFAVVLWRVLTSDRAIDAHCARLPLDDAPASSRPSTADADPGEGR